MFSVMSFSVSQSVYWQRGPFPLKGLLVSLCVYFWKGIFQEGDTRELLLLHVEMVCYCLNVTSITLNLSIGIYFLEVKVSFKAFFLSNRKEIDSNCVTSNIQQNWYHLLQVILYFVFRHVVNCRQLSKQKVSYGNTEKLISINFISFTIRRRRFPTKRKLLTDDEYWRQGQEETRKALAELRQHVHSPDCNAWKTISRLNSPHRYACIKVI